MKRKTIVVLVICCSLLFITANGFASTTISEIKAVINKNIKFSLNGEQVNLQNGVIQYNNTTYVPIREVSNLVDTKVDWDSSTQTVKLTTEQSTSNKDNGQKEKEKNNNMTDVNVNSEDVDKITFKGYQAFNYNGNTYFNVHDYEVDPKNQGKLPWKVDHVNRIMTIDNDDGSTTKVDLTNRNNFLILDGISSYINTIYYREN